ncbi:FAD:protein FMN transferase [Nonomuraea antimicrobica]|uniref:FAD:protein FMN transferase n=1 Tax=Nonomuraea antimicrobica TaxID=561173 RepID=A0ABP7E293_9ACTN
MREHLMGTQVMVAGLTPGEAATVFAWLRRVERTFSRFRATSDTGRVNGGGVVEVSELFLTALGEAIRYAEATDGLFSPWLAGEVSRAGYTVDFAHLGRSPAPDSPPGPSAHRSGGAVEVDFGRRTVRVEGGLGVDLGGFVKGWSVQKAAEALRSRGVRRGLIDAGGDLVCWRDPSDPPWLVGVEHPLDAGSSLVTLGLPAGLVAVATSSVARRSWTGPEGNRLHHLIDPRTGRPSESDCVQATVVTDDLGAAEVHAKCLVILGTEEGPRWLSARAPSARPLLVTRAGTLLTPERTRAEHGLSPHLQPEGTGVERGVPLHPHLEGTEVGAAEVAG